MCCLYEFVPLLPTFFGLTADSDVTSVFLLRIPSRREKRLVIGESASILIRSQKTSSDWQYRHFLREENCRAASFVTSLWARCCKQTCDSFKRWSILVNAALWYSTLDNLWVNKTKRNTTHLLHGAGIITNTYPNNCPVLWDFVGKYRSIMEHMG